MRINTNVSALAAANNLTRVQGAVSDSMAKLSSGFRINKAADDAAGLGIANKLRADGRSLTQASRNAEQTTSLLQVAEGATSTIQQVLERMKELATQSGSDTVDAAGRTRINAEFTALRSEIDRTVSTTKFQGSALLDGSFGQTANELTTSDISLASASTAATGTYNFSVSNGVVSLDRGATNVGRVTISSLSSSSYDAASGKTSLTFGSGATAVTVQVSASSATDAAGITAGLNGKSFGVTAGTVVHTGKLDATAISKGVSVVANTAVATGNGYKFVVTDASKSTTITAGNMTAAGINSPSTSAVDKNYVVRVIGTNIDVYDATDIGQTTSLAHADLSGYDGSPADTAVAATTAGTAAGFTSTFTIKAASNANVAAISTNFDAKTITVTGATVELQTSGSTLVGSQVKLGAWTDGTSKLSSVNVGGVTVSTDNLNAGGDTYAHLKSTLNAATIEIADRGTGPSTVNSNSVTGNSALKQASFLVDASGSYKTDDMLKLDALNLSVSNLGLSASDLSTAQGGRDALTTIDSALGTVASALGAIGANQNRIAYAMDNLKTKIANFSAAESVIRDVDMADEMTRFSKNNILAQAGTAMLAQANQAGQGVLQLLRG